MSAPGERERKKKKQPLITKSLSDIYKLLIDCIQHVNSAILCAGTREIQIFGYLNGVMMHMMAHTPCHVSR